MDRRAWPILGVKKKNTQNQQTEDMSDNLLYVSDDFNPCFPGKSL
jgi:hypothetical protein